MLKDKKLQLVAVLFVLFCCMFIIPLFNQGIMCGDELATRFYGMGGTAHFLKSVFNEQIEKGRALSAITLPFASYFGFLSSSNQIFRIGQVISIVLDAVLFAWLVYKLEKDKGFSGLVFVSLLAFLPISFENTAPNAFCTLFNIPFAILLLSFIFFMDFIDSSSKKKLLVSMVLLFVAECCYETFIAFTPIFLFLLIYKIDIRVNLKKIIQYLSAPFVVSCLYLIIYFICSKLYVSNYSGNQFGAFDLGSSLEILWHLFKACIPGFYLWGSGKYRFLLNYYMEFSVAEAVRIAILVVSFAGLFLCFYKKRELIAKKNYGKHILVILGGMICMVLPSLPIAVAEMYQGNVGENGFVALPVTYFSYYFAVFVLSYFVWFVLRKKWQSYVVLAVFCIMLSGIHFSNGVYAAEQNRNFDRLEQMENSFKTDIFKSFGNAEFASEDLFKTMNSMAFYDSYWTQFSQHCGNGAVINHQEVTGNENRIYFRYGKMFVWYGEDVYVFTYDNIVEPDLVVISDEECCFADYSTPITDHGMYVYYFNKKDLQ